MLAICNTVVSIEAGDKLLRRDFSFLIGFVIFLPSVTRFRICKRLRGIYGFRAESKSANKMPARGIINLLPGTALCPVRPSRSRDRTRT